MKCSDCTIKCTYIHKIYGKYKKKSIKQFLDLKELVVQVKAPGIIYLQRKAKGHRDPGTLLVGMGAGAAGERSGSSSGG